MDHTSSQVNALTGRGDGKAVDWSRILHRIVVAVCALWLIGYFFPPINHDTAVLLYISKLWINGGTLYIDAIDINTPLVFIVYSLPELLAKLTGLPSPTMLTALLGIGIAGSYLTCRRVLKASLNPDLAISAAVLPVLLLFLLIVYPNNMFSQREHIMLVLTMPYLLVASGRAGASPLSLRLRILTGLLAGLGFAMKPYFLVVPVLVELYILYQRGFRYSIRDAAPWSVLAVCVAHALFAVIVTPQYFTFVIPMARDFYSELGGVTLYELFINGNFGAPTVILPLLGIVAFWGVRSHLARVIFLAGFGGLFSAYAQFKGWSYHILPAQALTLLLAGAVIAAVLDNMAWLKRGDKRPARIFAAALMLMVFYQQALNSSPFYMQFGYRNSDTQRLLEIVKLERGNGRILILSPGIYPHFPLLNYANLRMTMPFESMWLLQGVYAECLSDGSLFHNPRNMNAGETFVFKTVSESFAAQQPSLLIVDKIAGIPLCGEDEFDYLEYFLQNPRFAEAFAHYEELVEYDRYAIYRRRD
ncbi:MAG: hypothetical protein KJ904_10475 [Alphaproteobacteria bacterium]|nr:hypothetical protein [Alphaproteobacteria bacterium]MBU0798201.1 hypothetical protein [Alphaproteobacteria bacterium]MBU0887581.1 hypothetical protein [Alphaproteobacteria bacterium]MBU1814232.1 hypothetical protein [Alphaproteobacteria bacterium]MBU2092181.1 hypothetical protein [Alphaproteobacteria bacterium]